jgi:hypothetical protein
MMRRKLYKEIKFRGKILYYIPLVRPVFHEAMGLCAGPWHICVLESCDHCIFNDVLFNNHNDRDNCSNRFQKLMKELKIKPLRLRKGEKLYSPDN